VAPQRTLYEMGILIPHGQGERKISLIVHLLHIAGSFVWER